MRKHSTTGHVLVTGHFIEDQHYSMHRPQGGYDWLLIYTLAGRGNFTHPKGTFTTRPHDVVLLAPGIMHTYGTAADRWQLLWAHFTPRTEWRNWLNWPKLGPGMSHLQITNPDTQSKIIAHLHKANDIMNSFCQHRTELGINALEAAILWCNEQTATPGTPATLGTPGTPSRSRLDERIARAMDHICRNHAKPLTLTDIAKQVGLSPSRFSHLFRQQADQTPQQFLELQRLSRARQLLELTSRTVSQIAHDVGFQSPFYFSLRFKRAFGKSPRTHRQLVQQK